MIDRVLGNKFAFAATVLAFGLARGWNTQQGAMQMPSHSLLGARPMMVAHGPSIPPDPWCPPGVVCGDNAATLVAHGPSIPPDPWVEGLVAHSPTMPPDPWVDSTPATVAA